MPHWGAGSGARNLRTNKELPRGQRCRSRGEEQLTFSTRRSGSGRVRQRHRRRFTECTGLTVETSRSAVNEFAHKLPKGTSRHVS